MYIQALKVRDALNCIISDRMVAAEFKDEILNNEDWYHIEGMVEWLDVFARVCTYLSGSKYPTLSMASLAFNRLLSHFNDFLVKDVEICESHSPRLTLQIQQEASERCLQYSIKYQENLKSKPSRIAMFLDPRYVKYLIILLH